MARRPGPSVRLRLTFSYAGFLVIAGAVLLALAWVVFLRRLPDVASIPGPEGTAPRLLVRADLIRQFVAVTAVALVFLLLVGLAGGWWLAGRMLAPLDRLTDAARKASDGSLSHRIGLPGRADEISELADAFDAMLARLEAHVAAQRRFAANASHELRTPLAISQSLLDTATSDPDADMRELIGRLREVNARAIDLTEALLLLSRADARSFARERVDLSLLAEEATETLLPLAESRGVTIDTTGDVAPALGSPALLLQLTTNLVHNAVVHNRPQRGRVRVTTTVGAESVALTVENTGPWCDPESAPGLTQPFRRGTGRVRSAHAGVGLGLSIAASIADAHDGTLDLTARPEGGMRATVTLPTPPPTAGH